MSELKAFDVGLGRYTEDGRSYEKWKHRRFIKWRKRWRELAEKFKEGV